MDPMTHTCNIDYQCLDVEEPLCRICFEGAHSNDKLLAPCKCTGSSRYIHQSCLRKWRFTNDAESESRNKCMECKYTYKTSIITKSVPLLFKIPINFHKKFCVSYIGVYVLINIIGDILYNINSYSNMVNKLAKYTLENQYSYGLIIPDLFFIICVNIYYYLLLKKLDPEDKEILIRHLTEVCIVMMVIVYVIPTFGLALVFFIMSNIYAKTFRDKLNSYVKIEEEVLNYFPDEVEPTHEPLQEREQTSINGTEDEDVNENISNINTSGSGQILENESSQELSDEV